MEKNKLSSVMGLTSLRLLTIISFWLFWFSSYSFSNVVYAKHTKLTVKLENASIKDALNYIENSYEFIFLYQKDILNAGKKVNINVKNQTIYHILDELFKGTDIAYEISDRQISLKKKPETPNPNQDDNGFKVEGIIKDSNGETIIGANIRVANTNLGTISDVDGKFIIYAPNRNAKLLVSCIGYKTQEISVNSQNMLEIVMLEDAEALEEVVVIGYGQQKKSSLVSAVNTITSSQLKVQSRNLSNNLAGQIAGLIAVQRSGEPGYDNAEFWIRGVSSFSGNTNPLVLVDGIPRSMNDVEADEIETFSLLKDAAATAVYGAEGANGVILITTKRGVADKARISVRAETSVLQPTRLPQYLGSYDYLTLYNEALMNAGSPAAFSDEILEKYRTGSDPELYPSVNWYDLLKDFTTNSRVTLNVRGGTEKAKYFVSGAYYHESGLFESNATEDYNANIGLNRFNLRSNIDFDVTPTTKISVDLSGQYLTTNYPGVGTQTLFTRMSAIPPHLFPMVYQDGTIAGHPDTSSNKINPYNLLNNSGYSREWRTYIQSRVGVVQQLDFITKGLSFKGYVSFDANMTYNMTRTKTVTQYNATGRYENGKLLYRQVVSGSDALGGASASNSGYKNIYLEYSLNYNRIFDKHHVGGMILYMQKDHQPHSQPLPNRKQGIVGRGSYSYDERYSLEANFGYTGSETFAKGYRFGFFPAVGAAWYLSNENFYSDKLRDVFNKMKFRVSFGRTGNDDTGGSRFLYRATMNTGAGGYNVGYTDGGSNGGVGAGIVEGQFYSPHIQWEIETKQNYGIELGLFNNRIDLQIDYFSNERKSILLERKTVAGAAGFHKKPYQNFGKVSNKGIDASIVLNQKIGDFHLSGRGNFTFARNKILEYDEITPAYPWMRKTGNRLGDHDPENNNKRALYEWIGFYTYDDFIITGEGINREYTYKEGVVQSGLAGDIRPGDLKYKDLNGDGIINSYDAQRGRINPENPEIVYGFGLSAEWKGIMVNVFFQGVGNTATVLGQGSNPEAFYPFNWGIDQSTVRKEFLNRWQDSDPYNFNVNYPRMRVESHAHNNAPSTFWVRDASFLRLKNVEISYTLPHTKKWLGVNSARIYLLGNNLAVWDKIKMWDPEMGNKNNGSAYPLSRTFTIGLDVTF